MSLLSHDLEFGLFLSIIFGRIGIRFLLLLSVTSSLTLTTLDIMDDLKRGVGALLWR